MRQRRVQICSRMELGWFSWTHSQTWRSMTEICCGCIHWPQCDHQDTRLFPATAQLDRSTYPQIKGSILFMSLSRHATLLRIRIGFSSYKLQNEAEMLKNTVDSGYGIWWRVVWSRHTVPGEIHRNARIPCYSSEKLDFARGTVISYIKWQCFLTLVLRI